MLHLYRYRPRQLKSSARNIIRYSLRANSTSASPLSSQPFKVLFCGRDEFSCLVFKELHAATDIWDEIYIATHPDTKTGRSGKQLAVSPLKQLGESLGVPVSTIPEAKPQFRTWQPPSVFTQVQNEEPPTNHVLITASFGRIIHNAMLHLFHPDRRLNVHPSLLPMYRGAAPIQHAIMRGDEQTGVCVIGMQERKMGIDAGPIWDMKRDVISPNETFPELRDRLAQRGGQLLVSVLRGMISGKAESRPQAAWPHAPLAPMISSNDAVVDFHTMTAMNILRRYHALAHQKSIHVYLPTFKSLQLHDLSVISASQLSSPIPFFRAVYVRPLDGLVVRCRGDTYLLVRKVKEQDRRLLTAKEWWSGLPSHLFLPSEGEAGAEGGSSNGNGEGASGRAIKSGGVRFLRKQEVWEKTGFITYGNAFARREMIKKAEKEDPYREFLVKKKDEREGDKKVADDEKKES